jgi:hypothetical protein
MMLRAALALLAALTLSGCQSKYLVYVYDATVGLDVVYSQEGTGRLLFGYERDTFALVPQKCAGPEDRKCEGEIMSLAAVSKVRAQGLEELDFSHFIATGKAARAVADDPQGIKVIRAAIYGDETTSDEEQR